MSDGNHEGERGQNWTPRPDPTLLTTEALMREVLHLRELLEGRIQYAEASCTMRFAERDLRFAQQDRDQREAVSAALAAAKEAVAKNEQSTDKRLDSITELITQKDETRLVQIADLAKRMDRGEGKGQGLNAAWGYGIAAITVIVGILTVIIIVLSR